MVKLAARDDIEFEEPSEQEVRAFFGVMMLMGLYDYHDRREYWSETMGHPFIRNVLTRDRFEALSRCLHVVDSSEADYANDQLASVRPFIDTLSRNFPRFFPHNEYLTVDERLKHFTVCPPGHFVTFSMSLIVYVCPFFRAGP
jgi:hypothetical protein